MQRVLKQGRRGPCAEFKLLRLVSLYTYCPSLALNPAASGSIVCPPAQKSQRSDRPRVQSMAFRIDAHFLQGTAGLERVHYGGHFNGCGSGVLGSFSSKMQRVSGRKLGARSVELESFNVEGSSSTAELESVLNSRTSPVCVIPEARAGILTTVDSFNAVKLKSGSLETGDNEDASPLDLQRLCSREKALDSPTLGSPIISNVFRDVNSVRNLSQEFTPVMNIGSTVSISEQSSGSSRDSSMGVRGEIHHSGADESMVWNRTLGSGIERHTAKTKKSRHIVSAVSKGVVELLETEREGPVTESNLLDRIKKLRQVIGDHSYRYHTLDNPVISDSAYDALVRELKDLESRLPAEETLNSVTSKVGAPPSPSMAKVRHAVPMLSLAAVYKEDELKAWHERLQQRLDQLSNGKLPSRRAWVVEPKVDGLALSLRYERGKLVCAATRGDGNLGREDVTHNARHISGLPQMLPHQQAGAVAQTPVLEIRGEVYMTLQGFQELNAIKVKAGEKPFANPRNAAAGSMRLLQTRDAEFRRLSFMAYTIVTSEDKAGTGMETSPELVETQWEALNILEQLGFSVNDDNRRFDSFEEALRYATKWRNSRPSLKYESDGVVFKVDDLSIQAELGAVGSDPRWAVAWKFAATEAVTVLEGIELSIGRSGSIIPTARLKPVELGGVTISRASLHNFGMVEKLGICEGDYVLVQRAGDVIPQVVQVLRALRPDHAKLLVPPERCPSCDGELTMSKDKHITSCCNTKCPGQHSRKIEHFAKTLFRGLGPSILSELQDDGMVADLADFYALNAATLSCLDGLGKKSAAKLVKAIEESKKKDLWELITALGIPTVGVSAAKLLEKWFGSIDRLLLSSEAELLLVPGVGTISAAAIRDWCMNPFNVQLVQRIKHAGFAPTYNDPEIHKFAKDVNSSDATLQSTSSSKTRIRKARKDSANKSEVEPLSSNEHRTGSPTANTSKMEGTKEVVEQSRLQGKNVVITGQFADYTREELEQLVVLNGGQMRKSVSSKTSFIVAGQFPGPSKMAKATQLNIPVYSLSTFTELLGHDAPLDIDSQSSEVPEVKHAMAG